MFSVIFPGQGSQLVGMGRELHEKYSLVQDLFKEADNTLGFSLSSLILDANEIYLTAVKSYILYERAKDMVSEIDPYLLKVKERVSLGISDPIELAIFSIKYNDLKSKLQLLKTNKRCINKLICTIIISNMRR